MSTLEQSIYPLAIGTEEETRLDIRRAHANSSHPMNSNELQHVWENSVELHGILPGNKDFRLNGSKMYRDAGGIELCTPECSNPEELATYIAANALILTSGVRRYLRDRPPGTRVMQQRRVVDGQQWNTWGCHDNFSLRTTLPKAPIAGHRILDETMMNIDRPNGKLMAAYLMTRNFITGSGVITPNGMYFSQKLSRPVQYSRYGYLSSLFRFDTIHGKRLEVRCNDVNLLDTAMHARVGGMVLILAAMHSGLAPKLIENLPSTIEGALSRSDLNSVEMLAHNATPIDTDNRLVRTQWLDDSIRFQRNVMQTVLDTLPGHEPIPEIYGRAGQRILDYCDDVDAVLRGRPLDTLADRADWAAKLDTVLASMERDTANGKPRELGDPKSQAVDMLYDRITLTRQQDGSVDTNYGYGYTLARQYNTAKVPAIQRAMHKPPRDTRAYERVRLANTLRNVTACDWHHVSHLSANRIHTIPLHSVLATS